LEEGVIADYRNEYIERMQTLIKLGKVGATVGGAAWTVKSLLIILMNDHFQPIEGVLYFLGVGGIVLGALGLGAFVAAKWTGAAQWLALIMTVALAIVITAFASSLVQEAVAASYTGSNVGVEEEIGILTPGVIWLAIGIYMMASRRRS
jgi:hypothetical protein